jgi:dolichyl-phosphate beta-glucosyltransferase
MQGVSIIIPVYNGEKFIKDNIERLNEFLSSNYKEYEIIVVDDGSTDRTYQVVLSVEKPRIKVESYKVNKGRGYALRKGFFVSQYENVLYTDADLPYNFEVLKVAIERLLQGESDIVICSRTLENSFVTLKYKNIHKLFLRWIAGRIINRVIRLFLGIPFYDTQAGLKGFRKGKVENIMKECFINRWAFDCEIIFLAHKNKLKISEVEAMGHFDAGDSTVKFWDGIEYIRDILRIFIRHKLGFRF